MRPGDSQTKKDWLSLWGPVSACGVPLIYWKVMVTATPAAMLIVDKEADCKIAHNDNRPAIP